MAKKRKMPRDEVILAKPPKPVSEMTPVERRAFAAQIVGSLFKSSERSSKPGKAPS